MLHLYICTKVAKVTTKRKSQDLPVARVNPQKRTKHSHLALLSILASGVNAHVNPCVICRKVPTACDDLAPFASAKVMSLFLGKNGTKSNISSS